MPYRKPRNIWVVLVSAVVVAAFSMAAYSIVQASHTGHRSRSALCQVLLFARKSSLEQQPDSQRLILFYDHVIGLVEGCRIPAVDER